MLRNIHKSKSNLRQEFDKEEFNYVSIFSIVIISTVEPNCKNNDEYKQIKIVF